jgi:ABC-type multidrug transport system permease subunit
MNAIAASTHDLGHWWRVAVATAITSFKRNNAYIINIIRMPVFPVGLYLTSYLAWNISGAEAVDGVNVSGFLLAGIIGLVCWSSSVWWTGYAIENERWEGTIAALFLSPASRIAVVAGHGIGGLLFLLPSFAMIALMGAITGAQLNVESFAAVAASSIALILASLAMGFLLASFFILTRRANLMANIIQHPLYLVGGFMVPRTELPWLLFLVSEMMPIAHAVDAFRASTIAGASFADVAGSLVGVVATSALFVIVGFFGIRKVEHAAKRAGQLDLF